MIKTKVSKFHTPLINSLILGACVAISSPAQAEIEWTGLYSGIYFSNAKDKFEADSGGKEEESRGHIKIKLGKYLNNFLSVEGQIGMTNNSDDTQGISTYGAYLRANKSFGKYNMYGMLGYSGIYSYHDDFDSVSESGGSYGVGLEIFGSKNLALSIEYLALLDMSVDGDDPNFGSGDLKFETIGIGLTYFFSDETSQFIKNRNKIRSIRD